MAAIGQLLAPHYDWLGFGDSDRPFINYEPTDFIKNHFNLPIIAQNH